MDFTGISQKIFAVSEPTPLELASADDTIDVTFPTVSYPYVSVPCGVILVFSRSMLSYV